MDISKIAPARGSIVKGRPVMVQIEDTAGQGRLQPLGEALPREQTDEGPFLMFESYLMHSKLLTAGEMNDSSEPTPRVLKSFSLLQ